MPDPAAPNRTILFAPAAGPDVGGGHVMRCLTLARALKDQGAACRFVVNQAGAALVARFGAAAFPIQIGSAAKALDAGGADILVIDDYATTPHEERGLRARVRRLVVIDDLADRPHPADLLIDPGHGRTEGDYEGLLPSHAACLVGPRYALVRAEFAALRPGVLARPLARAPERLFVSFGLSDVGGIALRAVAAVRARRPAVRIDVALASGAQSLTALKARAADDPALHLHIDALNVAELMAAADLAIGAGGASTWERCCLGLPTLAVIVADNQRAMIQEMAADGALLAVDLQAPDFEDAFTAALDRIWDQGARIALREKSAGLCDGLGAARVAEAILALI